MPENERLRVLETKLADILELASDKAKRISDIRELQTDSTNVASQLRNVKELSDLDGMISELTDRADMVLMEIRELREEEGMT